MGSLRTQPLRPVTATGNAVARSGIARRSRFLQLGFGVCTKATQPTSALNLFLELRPGSFRAGQWHMVQVLFDNMPDGLDNVNILESASEAFHEAGQCQQLRRCLTSVTFCTFLELQVLRNRDAEKGGSVVISVDSRKGSHPNLMPMLFTTSF